MGVICDERMVPKGGLEPPRVTSHAPQTCASTSSATSAKMKRIELLIVGRSSWVPCLTIVDEAGNFVIASNRCLLLPNNLGRP